MTYDPTIPFEGQNLSVSQVAIRANFNQLNVQFGNDHTAFNTGSGNGNGFHKKSTYISQLSDPSTGANQFVVYNKNDKLYGRGQNNGAIFEILGTYAAAPSGYIKLFGGILIQWARVTANNNQTITFPIAFSSAPFSIVANETSNGTGNFDFVKPNTASATASNFVLSLIRGDGAPQTNAQAINYIAIGPS